MEINTQELNSNYDSHKAKLNSSLKWILTKCKNESFTGQLNEDFENEDEDEIFILDKYSTLEANLCNGSLYRDVMLNVFPDSEKYITSNDFTQMIQWLLRKGIEIKDYVKNELLHSKPIDEEAHLGLINSIMKALNFRIFAIEKVVKAVRRFTTFSPSSELPLNLDATIYFWLNKVILFYTRTLRDTDPARYDTLSDNWSIESCEDLTDGRALCFILAFYYPTTFPIHDVETGEDLAIADCLYNLSIFYKFCSQNIFPKKLLAITVNDLFNAHNEMTVNIFSFLAELFLVIDTLPVISTFPLPPQINHTEEKPIIKQHCPSSILLPKRQKTFNSSSNIFNLKNELKTKERIKSANHECREALQSAVIHLRKETIPQAWEKEKVTCKSGKKYFPEIDDEVADIMEKKSMHEIGCKVNVAKNLGDDKIDPKKSYTITSKNIAPTPEKAGLSRCSDDVNSSLRSKIENERIEDKLVNQNPLNTNISGAENFQTNQIKKIFKNVEIDPSKNQEIKTQNKIKEHSNEHKVNNTKTKPLSEKMSQSECFSKPIAKSLNNSDLIALNLSRGFVNKGTFKINKKEKELKKSLKHDLFGARDKGKVDVPEKIDKHIGLVYEEKFVDGLNKDNDEIKKRILNDITIQTIDEPNINAVILNEDSTPTEEYELACSEPTMWVTALDDNSYEQDSLIPAQTSFIDIANNLRTSENVSMNNNVHYSPTSPNNFGRNNPKKSTTFTTNNSPFNKTSWVSIAKDQKLKNPEKLINDNNSRNLDKLAAKQQLVVKMDMEAKRRRIKEEWNLLQQNKKHQQENIGKKAFINTFLIKNEHNNKSKPANTTTSLEKKNLLDIKNASSNLDHSNDDEEKWKLINDQISHNEDKINRLVEKITVTKSKTSESKAVKLREPQMVSENNFSSRFAHSPHINELDEGFEKLRSEIKRLSVEQDKLKNYVEQISHNKPEQVVEVTSIDVKSDIISPHFNGTPIYDQNSYQKSYYIDSPYLNSSAVPSFEDKQKLQHSYLVSNTFDNAILSQPFNFIQYPISNLKSLVEQGPYNATFDYVSPQMKMNCENVSSNLQNLVAQIAQSPLDYVAPQKKIDCQNMSTNLRASNNYVLTSNPPTDTFTGSLSSIGQCITSHNQTSTTRLHDDDNKEVSKYPNAEIHLQQSLNPSIQPELKEAKIVPSVSEIDANMKSLTISVDESLTKQTPIIMNNLTYNNNSNSKQKEFFVDIRTNSGATKFPETEIQLKETYRAKLEKSDVTKADKNCEIIEKNIASVKQINRLISEQAQKINQLELHDDPNDILNDAAQIQVDDQETNGNNLVAPLAFVVGQLSNENMQLEKDARRQMITQQLEQRRREERERKRQIAEDERDKKKDLDRQRKEDQDKRRLEEKRKREVVFKNYLQRKVDANENIVAATHTQSSPLQTLNRKKKKVPTATLR